MLEVSQVSYCPNVCGNANCARGTLTIRRKFVNKTGQTVTVLRFRIVNVTTLNSPNATRGRHQLPYADAVTS
jgi:2-methylaconitate cis-trans-isomerase PrpF